MLRNTDSDWSMHDSVEKLQVHFHSPQIILPAQMTKKPMCEGHIRIIISHRLHDLRLPQCSYSIHRRILAVIGCYFGRLIGPGSPGPPVAIVRAVLPTQVLFYGGRNQQLFPEQLLILMKVIFAISRSFRKWDTEGSGATELSQQIEECFCAFPT